MRILTICLVIIASMALTGQAICVDYSCADNPPCVNDAGCLGKCACYGGVCK